jgi:photosystem II stability/assembly factor-like uncharacterized protein
MAGLVVALVAGGCSSGAHRGSPASSASPASAASASSSSSPASSSTSTSVQVFVLHATVAGTTGGPPPCASDLSGGYWGDAAHPEHAPLRQEAAFDDGHRWAMCGASPVFSPELLSLRSEDDGATWDVTVTPISMSPHHAGDDVAITLSSDSAGRVTLTSLVAASQNASYDTSDGGQTWSKS